MQLLAFPLSLTTLWLGLTVVPATFTGALTTGERSFFVFVWYGGLLSVYIPPLGIAEVAFVAWVTWGLSQERPFAAAVSKAFSLIGILVTTVAALVDGGRSWTIPVSRHRPVFILITLSILLMPLLWHLFVLWYLRGYPRWPCVDSEHDHGRSKEQEVGMATTRLRPLRPLGIAYFTFFPLTCFSLWILFGAQTVFVAGGFATFQASLEGFPWSPTLRFLNVGCCGLPAPLRWLNLALPPAMSLWLGSALFHRKAGAVRLAKWTALLLLPASLLGMVWDRWFFLPSGYPGPAIKYRLSLLLSLLCVTLPLVWHLFVLWYLRGYPWRRPKSTASSQPLPARA